MSAPAKVTMPQLSDGMEEGTLSRWLMSDGDLVSSGDDLAEIESDKATVTFQADADGALQIVVAEGETVSVGTVIAWLGPVSSDVGALVDGGERVAVASSRIRSSPLARRIAREHDLDISELTGSGPLGRIVRRDVEARLELRTVAANGDSVAAEAPLDADRTPLAAGPGPVPGGRGRVTSQSLTSAQAVVARRMVEARTTVPDFEVRLRVNALPALELRERIKVGSPETIPSLNDLVVKASALALQEQPRANGAYRDDTWELYERINVGIAVATEQGLVVPTIMDANQKTVGEIARASRRLAERARLGRLTPAELADGTFTVSNLGMFGVTSFSAVHFVPQAAILAVGSARPTPVVRDGQVVSGVEIELALSCDHRILYGADAARLLSRIQGLLENPLALLIA
jgi:pyruvate dehydrogenase E2 component (dihydrolipoamide acetyltransferase)